MDAHARTAGGGVMLVTADAQVFTLAEWQEFFQRLVVIGCYCKRCAEQGYYVVLERGRCPRCFELWEDK